MKACSVFRNPVKDKASIIKRDSWAVPVVVSLILIFLVRITLCYRICNTYRESAAPPTFAKVCVMDGKFPR